MENSQDLVPLTNGIRILAVVVALVFAGIVIELVRRRSLLEKYAFTWLFISFLVCLIAIFPEQSLGNVSKILGISNPMNLLFLLAIIGIGGFLLRLTVALSRLNQKNTRLTQELSILKEKNNKEI